MPTINISNRKIYYEWARKTDPSKNNVLVLLNGLVTDSRVYEQYYLKLIEKGYDLITIDNTNRGESTYQSSAISAEEMIEEVLAVIKLENINYPIWMGQSAFAGMALRLANSIKSAGVILESPVFTYQNSPRMNLFKTLLNKMLVDESMNNVAQFLGMICLSSSFLNKNPFFIMGMLMVIRNLYGHSAFKIVWEQIIATLIDGKSEFSELSCPALIIYGDEEFLQPKYLLQEIMDQAKTTFREIHSGHFIISEAPEQMFDYIDDFIKSEINN